MFCGDRGYCIAQAHNRRKEAFGQASASEDSSPACSKHGGNDKFLALVEVMAEARR
jgi:hypothetical protein